ncbi:glycosyltransferase family 2 protein [Olegusella massiliensis]|uniref:glycosyltransferase family 2 protein n=1 Tax=Olegusella massiliensis TaxID=1776381 RepID=UPI000838B40B|nr:glycosyltransferase family 2 protein [Olegusella massiliensis]
MTGFRGENSLCVVVPCYNEEATLRPFRAAIEKVEKDLLGYLSRPIDVVFIDDGSKDGTLGILRKFNEECPTLHFVSFSRNFGKEAGLLAGLKKALTLGDSHIAVMDVDLQDPPELLPQMFDRMVQTNCQIVATYRETRAGEPPIRSWFAHRFYDIMNKVSDVEMRDGARDFRLMTKDVVESITSLGERERFSKGIFMWVGYDTEWIGYQNIERIAGETHWNILSLSKYALNGIIAFSNAPLVAISFVGLTVFFLSILSLLFVIFRAALYGDPVAGWPSLVCIITLLSGLQLFCMGILSLYVSKIYIEAKDRPVYIVKEEC